MLFLMIFAVLNSVHTIYFSRKVVFHRSDVHARTTDWCFQRLP